MRTTLPHESKRLCFCLLLLLVACGKSSGSGATADGTGGMTTGGTASTGGSSAGGSSAGGNGTGGTSSGGASIGGGPANGGGGGTAGTGGFGASSGDGGSSPGTGGSAGGGTSGNSGAAGGGSGEGGSTGGGGSGAGGEHVGVRCGDVQCALGQWCARCRVGDQIGQICTPDPEQEPAAYATAVAACETDPSNTQCDGPEDCSGQAYCVVSLDSQGTCAAEPGGTFCCFSCGAPADCTLCRGDEHCPAGQTCSEDVDGAPGAAYGCQ